MSTGMESKFKITPWGRRVFELKYRRGYGWDKAIWVTQRDDGVSLRGRVFELLRGFVLRVRYSRFVCRFWSLEKMA